MVITHTKSIFARHGIPKMVKSDNGPQYSAQEYKRFSEEWAFKHVTSLYHPQANGLAEKSVQIMKQLLKKAKLDGKDPYISLQREQHRITCTAVYKSKTQFTIT